MDEKKLEVSLHCLRLENCERIYDTSLIRRKISNANYIHGIVVSCKSEFVEVISYMNDKWVEFAIRIQSIAQAGLQYGKDKYDRERYEELRQIAAEMLSLKTDIPVNKIFDLFCNESGYQTPKVDTRAAVFVDGKILLVHENNGTWSLPGGWCDVDQSVVSNTEKEVQEEAGFSVISEKIIAVQDWRKHNVVNYAYGVVKIFVLCRYEGGEFEKNIETTEIGFFDKNNLSSDLAVEKCTKEQILMCFDSYENPNAATLFD